MGATRRLLCRLTGLGGCLMSEILPRRDVLRWLVLTRAWVDDEVTLTRAWADEEDAILEDRLVREEDRLRLAELLRVRKGVGEAGSTRETELVRLAVRD